jgi:hypothetical protein
VSASLAEAVTRFAISHPAIGTIQRRTNSRMRSPQLKKVLCHLPHLIGY